MIEQLVEQIEARFAELERQMSDPEVIGDRERYAATGREYAKLEQAAKLAQRVAPRSRRRGRRARAAGGGRRRRRGARDAAAARERIEMLDEEIRLAMVERTPTTTRT